jgi:hypothetical protein
MLDSLRQVCLFHTTVAKGWPPFVGRTVAEIVAASPSAAGQGVQDDKGAGGAGWAHGWRARVLSLLRQYVSYGAHGGGVDASDFAGVKEALDAEPDVQLFDAGRQGSADEGERLGDSAADLDVWAVEEAEGVLYGGLLVARGRD